MGLQALFDTLQGVPAYRQVVAGLAKDQVEVVTVPDSAKPYVLSVLWQELGRPMVVVCPRPEDARRLADQLVAYCGDDAPIQHFAEPEVLPYERLALDAATVHQRLSVLAILRQKALQKDGQPPLIIVTPMGLMQKTLAPDLLDHLVHTVSVGDHVAMEPLLQRWVGMGYRLAPAVEEPGMVSRRGGIIDLYTPGLSLPARMELWGDRIDSIRLFDPASQRSIESVDTVTVLPALDVLPGFADHRSFEALVRALDYSNSPTAERDRVEEELAELTAGLSMENASFYAGFFNAHSLVDHIAPNLRPVVVVNEPSELFQAAQQWEASAEELRLAKQGRGDLPLGFPSGLVEWDGIAEDLHGYPARLELSRYHQSSSVSAHAIPFGAPPNYQSRLERLSDDLRAQRGGPLAIVTQHSQRVTEVLQEAGVGARETRSYDGHPESGVVHVVHGTVAEGWVVRAEDDRSPLFTLLTDTELFGLTKRQPPRARAGRHRSLDLEELAPGQFVVHIDHGIARFVGTIEMDAEGARREYLVLDYAQGDKLYVPMEHLARVAPYLSGAGGSPTPTRLGTQEWGRVVARAKESTKQLAFDLLQIYAHRELEEGHAFAPDAPWQREMEDAFPFVETPDQAEAIGMVKRDMEHSKPMDRLVCGDVGYGKTEVALRATFKAVIDSKQVAVLVPTTVLAQQHYETFTERFSGFPLRVEVLSRFRSDREQDQVVAQLKQGQIDVVIGTHRLLQKDVGFKDLGLVVVDEEHRFGVGHKEQLKNLRQHVDVLTMTATPIPRTLYMAMAGIRDISTMETPPEHRVPIKTYLGEESDELIREAILRELDRGGQVFYLHNRVKSIDLAAYHLRQLVPEATVWITHGQMPVADLAQVMAGFADGDADVLLCTTIIESGLDLPSVNTLIVERADRFGLAQLYQLRGRIGRRAHRAYAYLLVPKGRKITDTAQRRLQTVMAATELGAGFRIAMKDLEIRGAGNILGPEQSGHIHAVGFDLYTRLLAEAVDELRIAGGQSGDTPAPPGREAADVQVDLGLPASIPEWMVEHLPTRMALYQRMARATHVEEVDELAQELRDRFGALPEEADHLLYGLRVRALAHLAHVESVVRHQDQITLKPRDVIGDARLPLEKALGHGARAGHQQVRVSLAILAAAAVEGTYAPSSVAWGEALLEVLQRLAEFQQKLAELFVGTV